MDTGHEPSLLQSQGGNGSREQQHSQLLPVQLGQLQLSSHWQGLINYTASHHPQTTITELTEMLLFSSPLWSRCRNFPLDIPDSRMCLGLLSFETHRAGRGWNIQTRDCEQGQERSQHLRAEGPTGRGIMGQRAGMGEDVVTGNVSLPGEIMVEGHFPYPLRHPQTSSLLPAVCSPVVRIRRLFLIWPWRKHGTEME